MAQEYEAIKIEIAKLELSPTDILVLKTSSHIPMEKIDQIKKQLQNLAPKNKVAILTPGLDLTIIQP
jgi:hypothetical protein